MTDISQFTFCGDSSDTTLEGRRSYGVEVGPFARSAKGPHLVGESHGILTGDSDITWPDFGTFWFWDFAPNVRTITSHYFELPLPRIAALRNPDRSRRLAMRLRSMQDMYFDQVGVDPAISLVSHSNGAVLNLQAARLLIEDGIKIHAMVLIAPAIRTKDASEEIDRWLLSGMLGRAVLVRPRLDGLLSLVSRAKIASWPWGSLGHDGWAVDRMDSFDSENPPMTIDLPNDRHSDPVSVERRGVTFREIIAPALGLSEWPCEFAFGGKFEEVGDQ